MVVEGTRIPFWEDIWVRESKTNSILIPTIAGNKTSLSWVLMHLIDAEFGDLERLMSFFFP